MKLWLSFSLRFLSAIMWSWWWAEDLFPCEDFVSKFWFFDDPFEFWVEICVFPNWGSGTNTVSFCFGFKVLESNPENCVVVLVAGDEFVLSKNRIWDLKEEMEDEGESSGEKFSVMEGVSAKSKLVSSVNELLRVIEVQSEDSDCWSVCFCRTLAMSSFDRNSLSSTTSKFRWWHSSGNRVWSSISCKKLNKEKKSQRLNKFDTIWWFEDWKSGWKWLPYEIR